MKKTTIILLLGLSILGLCGIVSAQTPTLIGTIAGVPGEDNKFADDNNNLTKGDVNGDGYTDLVVGARGYGKIRIFLGDALGIDGTADWTVNLPSGITTASRYGDRVACGDLNNDGYDDVAVGAPWTTIGASANAGNVYIYYGGATMDTVLDLDIPCPHPFKTSAWFGRNILIGNFDSDPGDDMYVAASRGSIWGKTPYYRPGNYYEGPDAETYNGIVYYFSGSSTFDGTPFPDPIIGQSSSGQAGDRAMDKADVNNDGYDDLLLGEHAASYNHDNKMEECGKVTLYLGGRWLDHAPDVILPKQDTSLTYEFFGNTLSSAGDYNGDGSDDMVVGVNPSGGQTTGRIYLFYGPLRKLDADVIITPPAEANSLQWGVWNGMAWLGDINDDGYDDFSVHGYMDNNGDGKAYIYLGGAQFSDTRYFTLSGETGSFSGFGYAAEALGDINGDAIDDFAISAPSFGNASSGKLYLFAGSQSIVPGVSDRAVELPSEYALKQNFPNPFNPGTTIEFSLAKSEKVTLKIYNNLGQEIKTLVERQMPAGSHSVKWDGTDAKGRPVVSGAYYYQILGDEQGLTKKMLLLK